MSQLILDHFEGCTPTTPCISCKANEFLRRHLSAEIYAKFVAIISSSEIINLDAQVNDVLELSVRSKNCFRSANIITVRDLIGKTSVELLRISNFGRKNLHEIQDELGKKGLKLAG